MTNNIICNIISLLKIHGILAEFLPVQAREKVSSFRRMHEKGQLVARPAHGNQKDGIMRPFLSHGKYMPSKGSRSSNQMASGLYFAKKTLPIHDSCRHWTKRSTIAACPMISSTPVTSTFPGVALMTGPRTVRHKPDVDRRKSVRKDRMGFI